MKNVGHSIGVGVSFGLGSGVITTLGLLVGLAASTEEKIWIVGILLLHAVVDSFADSFGIHMAEESGNDHPPWNIWISTVSTFVTKFCCTLSFVVPIWLITSLQYGVVVGIAWGMLLIVSLSCWFAKNQKISWWRVTSEHLLVAMVVIVISHYVGIMISESMCRVGT